jgi:hypothetical protein
VRLLIFNRNQSAWTISVRLRNCLTGRPQSPAIDGAPAASAIQASGRHCYSGKLPSGGWDLLLALNCGDGAGAGRVEAVKEGSRHNASARLRSSCSNALAIRLTSAERAPTALAASHQVAVTVATSLTIPRAYASVSPKYSDAASSRSSEQVPSSRSMFVVSTRALRSVGTGLRSYAGERDQPAFPSHRKP